MLTVIGSEPGNCNYPVEVRDYETEVLRKIFYPERSDCNYALLLCKEKICTLF